MTADHPRVLVVGSMPFSRSTNDGITLSNLFQGWPPERLAQVHTADVPRSTDVCDSFYHFGLRNFPVDQGLRRLVGAATGTDVATGAGTGTGAAAGGGRVPAGGDRWSGRPRLGAQARAAADLTPYRFPVDLPAWLRAHRPQVVHSMLGSVRVIRLATRIARELDVPLVPHFMDDWPSTHYGSGELLGLARVAVLRELRAAMRLATRGMCISEPMAREYEQRYGIPFAAFANCVDDAAFAGPADLADDRAPTGDPVELVYVGGLHLERWRSLARIGRVLDERGGDLRLSVYAPEADLAAYRACFAGLRSVRLDRWLSGDEVPKVLRAADVLVHVESFAPRQRRYTRLSLSTKIPQYLASGRPVLGFGPRELASMRHLVEARAGVVVGADDPARLRRALDRLRDPATRREWGRNGLDFARRHHRRESLAARFASFLAQVAADGPVRRSSGRGT